MDVLINESMDIQSSIEYLSNIKETWLSGKLAEANQLFQKKFPDFPDRPTMEMDIDFFCDVYITGLGIEIDYQRAKKALHIGNKIALYIEEIKKPLLKIRYHNNLAVCHRCMGNFCEMLNHLEQAFTISEETNTHDIKHVLTINLANAYTILGYYSKARNIYEDSQIFYENLNYTWRVGKVFQQMGNLSIQEGDTGLAKSHLLIALDEFGKIDNEIEIADTYGYLAKNANESNLFVEARNYALGAIDCIGKDSDSPILAFSLTEYARSFQNDKKEIIEKHAFPALESALELSYKNEHLYNCLNTYQALAEIYAQTSDYEKAYRFEKSYNNLLNTLLSKRTFAKVRQTELTIDAIGRDKDVEPIQKENNELKTKIRQLQDTLEDNELFMKILSHDLKNPLGSIYSVSSMLQSLIVDETQKQEVNWIYRESKRIHEFVGELTRICRFENKWTPNLSAFDLNATIGQTLNEIFPHAETKSVTIEFNYNPLENMQVGSDWKAIGEIIRSILLTGIHYAKEKQNILCQTSEIKKDLIELSIQIPNDNCSDIVSIFDPSKKEEEQCMKSGSVIYRLGLKLAIRLSERLHCRLQYDKNGTTGTFSLLIPNKIEKVD